MVNRDLKKLRNKAFFMIGCKHTGEIEYDLTKNEKIFTYKALVVVALKKISTLFTIFPDFISTFQIFFRSGKLLRKFQDFFKNS